MSRKKVELYEETLPDGRCKYRLPYKDPLTDKRKTLSLITETQSASNYKLAKRVLEERLDNIMNNVGRDKLTLRELADLFIEDKSRSVKPSTAKRIKSSMNTFCRLFGDDILVERLSVPIIRKTILDNTENNYTYNEHIRRMKSFLLWGYLNDYLPDRSLPDKLRPLPDDKKSRIEDKYLEREELQKLLDNCEIDLWRYMIHFLALSGLRIGEVISLKDSDVDDMYIHVKTTYEVVTNEIASPKTRMSIRDVYIRQELRKLIREIRLYIKQENLKNGVKTELFMCNQDGGYIRYSAFHKFLARLSARTIDRVITPHALRHTAASLLIADGVPLETVSRMLGHEDSKITKEIYLHMTQTLRKRDNELLENARVL